MCLDGVGVGTREWGSAVMGAVVIGSFQELRESRAKVCGSSNVFVGSYRF